MGDVQDRGPEVTSRIESPRRVRQADDRLQTQMGLEWTSTNLLLSTKKRYSAHPKPIALLFLAASREALKLSGIERPEQLVRRVNDALLELLKHRYECPVCNAM